MRRLIEATATARTHLNDDRIWVYHNAGGLRAGIRHPTERIDDWVAQNDIVDDDGKPLHLLLSRLRKTPKALWYTKTDGHIARFAVGHSPEAAARPHRLSRSLPPPPQPAPPHAMPSSEKVRVGEERRGTGRSR